MPSAVDLDVGGFEIAVDDAFLVRRLQRLGDLESDFNRFLDRGNRATGNALGKRLALGELHDQEVDRFRRLFPGRGELGRLKGVDGSDPGVIECSEHSGFALEPGQTLGAGRERLRQHLDRHLAAQLRVCRPVDLSHAPRTELLHDSIVANALAVHGLSQITSYYPFHLPVRPPMEAGYAKTALS